MCTEFIIFLVWGMLPYIDLITLQILFLYKIPYYPIVLKNYQHLNYLHQNFIYSKCADFDVVNPLVKCFFYRCQKWGGGEKKYMLVLRRISGLKGTVSQDLVQVTLIHVSFESCSAKALRKNKLHKSSMPRWSVHKFTRAGIFSPLVATKQELSCY